MTPERWAEIERIFHEASAREAPARTAYLDEQCADDRELRLQVEKYLALEQGGESLLDRPALEHYEPPSDDQEEQLPPGTRLGAYRIVERIGAGGMGVVYRGEDSRLHRKVAIKVLQPALCSTPELRQRFDREARAIAALNHPNVCTLYDVGRDGAMDYFVMELLDGETLAARLRAGVPTIQETLRIAVDVAGGLAAAHGAGIIHRDLKPANVMLTSNGAKLLDFGISKTQRVAAVDATTHTSLTGVAILGTSEYMSPEQAQGLKLDSRSDIFSFGAVLYEMLTGERAFRGETRVSTIAAILNREPEPLAKTTPHELERILQRCLRKDPAKRFQTMADLKVALEELKVESDSGRLAAPPVPVAGKRRWPLLAVSVAMVALAIGGAWWRWGVRSTPTTGPRNLRQLTHDEGFTGAPSLSPDATRVAYQTDRAGPGRYDIWVQQTMDGSEAPLTKGPGRHTEPVFSHDGSKVYFTSDGPPQGIYEIGALGGEPRLIAADGEWPSVSPDGNSIAYIGPRSRQIFVVPASGGEPRPIAQGFLAIDGPVVWHPDGQQVVFVGMKAGPSAPAEYWLAPVSAGIPRLLSWGRWGTENRFFGRASAWLADDFVVSWLVRDGNSQVYRMHHSSAANGALPLAPPEPLTYGGSINERPSVAAGKLAFQSGTPQSAIWSLPADTNQGRVTGAMEKLTTDKAAYCCAALTPDGKILAFVSDRIANENRVFVRDMVSGQERTVTRDEPDRDKIFVQIDASGTRVAYTTTGRTVDDPHIVSAQGGATRKVCDNCGFRTNSLSADGKQFLATEGGNPRSGITLVDVDSGKSTLVLKHSQDRVSRPRFSPDEKWIVFLVNRNATSLDVMLAPFRGATSVPEQDWITVTTAPANVSQAFWSPDGGILYYIMDASGSHYLMARRLDRKLHPAGAPFRVFEFPGRVHPLLPYLDAMTAVPGRFIGAMRDLSYNIWIMDLPK